MQPATNTHQGTAIRGDTYAAENLSNISGRLRKVLGNNLVVVAYGEAVNAMCCSNPKKVGTATFVALRGQRYGTRPGYYMEVERRVDMRIDEDRNVAMSHNLFPEDKEVQENRFMKFYDSITGMDVEVGIPQRKFRGVEQNLRDVTGEQDVSFRGTFLGIWIRELLNGSRFVRSGNGGVTIPSDAHQLYLLHAKWSSETNGRYSNAGAQSLAEYFQHHFGSMEALASVPYHLLGVGGKRYSAALQTDIGRILRTD